MCSRASAPRLVHVYRRQMLCGVGALVVASACRKEPSREGVLSALVDEVLAFDLAEVEQRSRDLARAARRLAAAPAAPELTSLRATWRRAALAWKRASAFRAGPLLTSEALARATYWPTRSAAIRDLLEAGASLSASLVAELGADVKGLYALEYLLFDQDGEAPAWERLSGAGGVRARELVCLYADGICAHGESARRLLGSGEQSYAGVLSRGGQESLNRIVSLLAESVENLVVARLTLVLWLASLRRLRSVDVEGGPGRISHELGLALLLGTQQLYLGGSGGGLGELVARAAPQIHQHLSQAFERSIAALRALAAPIESVAVTRRERVEAALGAAKALEMTLKNDLSSALGVTLTFTSFDAD